MMMMMMMIIYTYAVNRAEKVNDKRKVVHASNNKTTTKTKNALSLPLCQFLNNFVVLSDGKSRQTTFRNKLIGLTCQRLFPKGRHY